MIAQKIFRKKIIGFTLVFFLSLLAARESFGAMVNWTDVSGRGGRRGVVSETKGAETSIAISETGKVFVAFQDKRDRIYVRVFNGKRWRDIPDGSKTKYLALNGDKPALAVNGEELFVVYKDLDVRKKARVRKWDGSSWSDLADANHPSGYLSSLEGFEPVLTFDNSKENLYVAFRDEANGQRIKVMSWSDGGGWQAVADPNNPDGLVSDSTASEVDLESSKINSDIFVAYEDIASGGRVRTRKWDGSSWSDLEDVDHLQGYASENAGFSPSIESDELGNLYIVYTGENTENTYVKKWNGTNWQDVGGNITVQGMTIESTLAVDQRNFIYLAYSQKTKNAWHVRSKIWNGFQWVDSNYRKSQNISKGKGKGDPSLAISENRLYMSFTDARNKNRARVKMLNFVP